MSSYLGIHERMIIHSQPNFIIHTSRSMDLISKSCPFRHLATQLLCVAENELLYAATLHLVDILHWNSDSFRLSPRNPCISRMHGR